MSHDSSNLKNPAQAVAGREADCAGNAAGRAAGSSHPRRCSVENAGRYVGSGSRGGRGRRGTSSPNAISWAGLFSVSLAFHVSLIIMLSLLVAFMPPVRQLMVVVATEPAEMASPDESSPPDVLIPDVRRAVGDESLARIPAESRLRVPTIDTAEPTIKPYRPRRSAPTPSPDQLLVRSRATGGGFSGA